jgi:hypothetical protein
MYGEYGKITDGQVMRQSRATATLPKDESQVELKLYEEITAELGCNITLGRELRSCPMLLNWQQCLDTKLLTDRSRVQLYYLKVRVKFNCIIIHKWESNATAMLRRNEGRVQVQFYPELGTMFNCNSDHKQQAN